MRKHYSTKTVTSALDSQVSYTLRVLTEGVRIRLRQELSAPLAELFHLRRQVAEHQEAARDLSAQLKAASPGEVERLLNTPVALDITRLQQEIERVESDIVKPAYVRVILRAVAGLEIDDQPATVDAFIESGPRDLYLEALAAVERELGLSETETKNSESPTISTALEGGAMSNTSAGPVSDAETTTRVPA